MVNNNELNIILEQIHQWIHNCDTKSSIVLSLIGVLLGIIFTTGFIKKVVLIYNFIPIHMSFLKVFYLIFLLILIICLVNGIYYLILSINAKIKINPENGLITNSLIYYKTINDNFSFKEYEKKYVN